MGVFLELTSPASNRTQGERERRMALDTKAHKINLATVKSKPLPEGFKPRPKVVAVRFIVFVHEMEKPAGR